MSNTVKIIGALVVGSLIGGALGLLFAPEKGKVTRENFANKAKGLASDIGQKMQANRSSNEFHEDEPAIKKEIIANQGKHVLVHGFEDKGKK